MLLYPSFAISLLLIYIVLQQEQEKQLIEKELELSDSRIKVMVSQIQPHFLYNTLNSIYHLCEKDNRMAQQAISDFSDYLRMNLKSLDHTEPIPFKEELRHVKTYLHLEKMRFEEDLRVEYRCGSFHAAGIDDPAARGECGKARDHSEEGRRDGHARDQGGERLLQDHHCG